MPSLYSADITDLAKPVKKERKTKQKKSDPENDVPVPSQSTAPETPVPEKPAKKEKKPATEKQLEALKKAQEARKRKREEKVAAVPPVTEPSTEVPPVPEKPKRKRQKKDTVSVATMDTDTRVDVEVDRILKPKKPRAPKNPSDPPKWFVQYVNSVKSEESKHAEVKKPKKVIAEEAGEQAKTSWNDGLVRDRVRNEVDNHMNRMYSMIFGARRMN